MTVAAVEEERRICKCGCGQRCSSANAVWRVGHHLRTKAKNFKGTRAAVHEGYLGATIQRKLENPMVAKCTRCRFRFKGTARECVEAQKAHRLECS